MESYNKFLTMIILTFLLTLSIINLVVPNKNFSDPENRILAKKPVFSLDNLISGKFTTEYEEYITDQFAFRDFWVGIKSLSERFLQKKDNNGVYFGKDGYLLQKPKRTDHTVLEKNIQTINKFASTINPVPVYFLLAPNSTEILTDKLPIFAPVKKLEVLQKVQEKLDTDVRLIDVFNTFLAHRDEIIYYKTDHHWTSLGAYYAYQEAGKTMDFMPFDINDFEIQKVTDSFLGTLYSKSAARFIEPDFIELFKLKANIKYKVQYLDGNKSSNSLYELEHLNKKDKYSVFLDGNHALVKITTQNKTDRKLLVLKDSYAHSFIPFLANHFDEIHMIDLRYFNLEVKKYIKENGLSEILLVYNTVSFSEDNSILKIGLNNN